MNKISRLRVSYSMLSLAEKGMWGELTDMLFRKERPISRAMEEGREIHKEIEEHIVQFNCMPSWLFSGSLVTPKSEEKIIMPYNELYDLSGVFDCMDDATKTLYEFKTGVQSSTDWARTHQIPIYFMMLGRLGREVDKAFLIHWNQHTKKKDWVVIHNSPEQIKKAENYIDTYASEIYLFLQNEGIL